MPYSEVFTQQNISWVCQVFLGWMMIYGVMVQIVAIPHFLEAGHLCSG